MNKKHDNHTYKEIMGQPEALLKTWEKLQQWQTSSEHKHVIHLFTGCGTSFHLAVAAARFHQEVTGYQALAKPVSELILNDKQVFSEHFTYKIYFISRSGTTSEMVYAIQHLKHASIQQKVAITCHGNSAMALSADTVMSLDHIREKSVVMTQSFTNMLYALQIIAAKRVNDHQVLHELQQLPDLCAQVLQNCPPINDLASNMLVNRFIFLGSGIYYGLAAEGTLKVKEMTQTECEAYSPMEFRHGPLSMVDEHTVVILLLNKQAEAHELPLISEIQDLGGYAVGVGDMEADQAQFVMKISAPLQDATRALLFMPYLQMLAYYRALALNMNPDQPRHLNQVVKISLPHEEENR